MGTAAPEAIPHTPLPETAARFLRALRDADILRTDADALHYVSAPQPKFDDAYAKFAELGYPMKDSASWSLFEQALMQSGLSAQDVVLGEFPIVDRREAPATS